MTGKNSTHALGEIQEAIGNVKLSREDEEFTRKYSKICASSFLTFYLREMRCEVRNILTHKIPLAEIKPIRKQLT